MKNESLTPKQKNKYRCLLCNTLPFSVTQIINPFLNSISSANHEKWKEFQPK